MDAWSSSVFPLGTIDRVHLSAGSCWLMTLILIVDWNGHLRIAYIPGIRATKTDVITSCHFASKWKKSHIQRISTRTGDNYWTTKVCWLFHFLIWFLQLFSQPRKCCWSHWVSKQLTHHGQIPDFLYARAKNGEKITQVDIFFEYLSFNSFLRLMTSSFRISLFPSLTSEQISLISPLLFAALNNLGLGLLFLFPSFYLRVFVGDKAEVYLVSQTKVSLFISIISFLSSDTSSRIRAVLSCIEWMYWNTFTLSKGNFLTSDHNSSTLNSEIWVFKQRTSSRNLLKLAIDSSSWLRPKWSSAFRGSDKFEVSDFLSIEKLWKRSKVIFLRSKVIGLVRMHGYQNSFGLIWKVQK